MAKNKFIDIDFVSKSVNVSGRNGNSIEGTIEEMDYELMLDGIGIDAVIEYFGEGLLLDTITRDTAIKHFNIEEAE